MMNHKLTTLKTVDMSSEAIDERFRTVESLRKLGLSLQQTGMRGPIGKATDAVNDQHKTASSAHRQHEKL